LKSFGIYLHFPFCVRKCHYCDFYSIKYRSNVVDRFITALQKEVELYGKKFGKKSISTLYLGGGSPNLIQLNQFVTIMEALNSTFDLSSLKEFTVELNPGRVQAELLNQFKQSGVDRLSIGIQSFHDQELQTLGRIHNVADIWHVGEQVRQIGFKHLNVDLIYGIPGQTLGSWKSSLEQLLLLPVDHVSLYNLCYERGTLLDEWRQKRMVVSLDPELEWQMYSMAHDFLKAVGFRHYEISNWAKPGSESRHNCGYWSGKNYLGLGPAAHSFYNQQRWWNYRSVEKYIKTLSASNFPIAGQEQLTKEDREIEYIFLGLRTAQGLSVRRFNNLFLVDFKHLVERLAEEIGSDEYWIFAGDSFKLTLRGWFVCDSLTHQILQLVEDIKHGH